jgi:hypothetical protein
MLFHGDVWKKNTFILQTTWHYGFKHCASFQQSSLCLAWWVGGKFCHLESNNIENHKFVCLRAPKKTSTPFLTYNFEPKKIV